MRTSRRRLAEDETHSVRRLDPSFVVKCSDHRLQLRYLLLSWCEEGAVRAGCLWHVGGAVRRHSAAVARLRHLANLATDLEPAFWYHHWCVSDDRSNCRWNRDAVPSDRALGFG